MDYQSFKNKLKECNLNIKQFAEICGLNPKSISITWKSKNETPKWVDSWLENYLLNQKINDIKTIICDDTPQNP